MINYNLEEAELIKAQIGLSLILLVTTIISISLSYNFLLDLEDKKTIYSDKESYELLIFNRTILFTIALMFLYINIKDKNIKEKYNLEDEFADLQIDASLLNNISALIALYVGLKSGSNVTSSENPTI